VIKSHGWVQLAPFCIIPSERGSSEARGCGDCLRELWRGERIGTLVVGMENK